MSSSVRFSIFIHLFFCQPVVNDGVDPHLPKSSESQVSDVSVPVTFVANVDADSVDVLIVVSAVDADDAPITITFVQKENSEANKQTNKRKLLFFADERMNEKMKIKLSSIIR